jgi:hypothetical protein
VRDGFRQARDDVVPCVLSQTDSQAPNSVNGVSALVHEVECGVHDGPGVDPVKRVRICKVG